MSKFEKGDKVKNIQTEEIGYIIMVHPPRRGTQMYKVKYDDREDDEYSEKLQPNVDPQLVEQVAPHVVTQGHLTIILDVYPLFSGLGLAFYKPAVQNLTYHANINGNNTLALAPACTLETT